MNAALLLLVFAFPQGQEPSTLEKIEREITAIVEKAAPSVVQVSAKHGGEDTKSNILLPYTRKLTGIVISADGYILTDLGGVAAAQSVEVTLQDGRTFKAERRGTDRATSVALLQIAAEGLKPASFADEGSLRQGAISVLVSNPAGLRQSSSVGFLSGLNRTVRVDGVRYENLIQTSAAVQAGDAGGLLANSRGLLVGMIHSRYIPDSLDADAAGFLRPVPREAFDFLPAGGPAVGFATPAPTLKFVADRLMREGKVVRGWAGIALRRVGDETVVSEVTPEGPSWKAGIRAGDTLLEFDGQPVNDLRALRRHVIETPSGHTVRVRVQRGTETKDINFKLTIAPEPQK